MMRCLGGHCFCQRQYPTKTFGVGAGRAADVRFIEAVARMIAEVADKPKIIVEKSTIPVKTAETILTILSASGKKLNHESSRTRSSWQKERRCPIWKHPIAS